MLIVFGRFVTSFLTRPQIRRDDPLNLSILLSGGKETNQDSLSSGERRGKSPAPSLVSLTVNKRCGVYVVMHRIKPYNASLSDKGYCP
ncbi:uncharacterized [Tachysurus ichikawai]